MAHLDLWSLLSRHQTAGTSGRVIAASLTLSSFLGVCGSIDFGGRDVGSTQSMLGTVMEIDVQAKALSILRVVHCDSILASRQCPALPSSGTKPSASFSAETPERARQRARLNSNTTRHKDTCDSTRYLRREQHDPVDEKYSHLSIVHTNNTQHAHLLFSFSHE